MAWMSEEARLSAKSKNLYHHGKNKNAKTRKKKMANRKWKIFIVSSYEQKYLKIK